MQKDIFVLIQYNKTSNKFDIKFINNAVDSKTFQADLIQSEGGDEIVFNSFFVNPNKTKVSKPNIFIYSKPLIIPFVSIRFGLLYNFNAITSPDQIYKDGWFIPTRSEWNTILNPLNDSYTLTPHYRLDNPEEWAESYYQHLNDLGFNSRPSGFIDQSGNFLYAGQNHLFASITSDVVNSYRIMSINYNDNSLSAISENKKCGSAVRIVKTNTTLQNGQDGRYTGNDGQIYRTICINGYEILADNLAETKFRSGSLISKKDNAADFVNSAQPACIAYDLNDSYIYY